MTQAKKKKGISHPESQDMVKLYAFKSKALDVDCYRGFARLSDLARISNADEYNAVTNPSGIQRELNKQHAREAYNYASKEKEGEKRIWPEIILNLRDKAKVKREGFSPIKNMPSDTCSVKMKIDLTRIDCGNKNPTFSRVDGNHRLFYAGGIEKKYPQVDVMVPFCILDGVSIDQEKRIFRTINEEQKGLSTDHILRTTEQLTPDAKLMEENPVHWLTNQLRDQHSSPFYDLVRMPGKKERGKLYIIKHKSLYDGIRIFYGKLGIRYKKLDNLQSLSILLIHYFNAVKRKWQEEWMAPKGYLLMTNTGMQALGFVGAELIERQINAKEVKEEHFYNVLRRVDFSWKQVKGEEKLQTGRAGGEMISQKILAQVTGTDTDLSQLLSESEE